MLLATGVLLLSAGLAGPSSAAGQSASSEAAPDADMHFQPRGAKRAPAEEHRASTADHTGFEALQGPFADGREVTEACLSCHSEAGAHVMESLHWTWDYVHPETGQQLGKKYLVNNFCTNSRGNEGVCAQCHAGYGWKDASFDFDEPRNIDCLVCHEQTGDYYKTPNAPGHEGCTIMFPDRGPIEWARSAQSVAMPSRQNCGTCHFYGGGGDGVKHGDLDSSLIAPPTQLDVHMSPEGEGFRCQTCHVSDAHQIAGSRYNVRAKDPEGTGRPGFRRRVATCESCHGLAPHAKTSVTGIKLNDHIDRVACQSCHIPQFARGGVATMIDWDWRTAGKTRDGEGFKLEEYTQGDGSRRATYKSIKGDFAYGENLVPEYHWFNGQMRYTTIDTNFAPEDAPIAINAVQGSADDPGSRLWPFKRMHTVQPFDDGHNTLVYMHLWGQDEAAFWGNYDFGTAIETGMAEQRVPYSGDYSFVETVSFWPITHMVAPAEEALDCGACHAREGRLAGLGGFYLPGGGDWRWIDFLGGLLVLSALLGVLGHTALRLLSARTGAR